MEEGTWPKKEVCNTSGPWNNRSFLPSCDHMTAKLVIVWCSVPLLPHKCTPRLCLPSLRKCWYVLLASVSAIYLGCIHEPGWSNALSHISFTLGSSHWHRLQISERILCCPACISSSVRALPFRWNGLHFRILPSRTLSLLSPNYFYYYFSPWRELLNAV